MDELLDVIVKIRCLLGIFQHNQMIVIFQCSISVQRRKYNGGKRACQFGTGNLLGMGQNDPVCNLQNAGGLCITFNKKLQVHASTSMQRYTKD